MARDASHLIKTGPKSSGSRLARLMLSLAAVQMLEISAGKRSGAWRGSPGEN
jgi:hypothetical protein